MNIWVVYDIVFLTLVNHVKYAFIGPSFLYQYPLNSP